MVEGDSWSNFETHPYTLANSIDPLKLTQAGYFVFDWKPWSANYLVLSALVIDPRFNVMSYFGKGQYAQLPNYLCARLYHYMKTILYPSFFSCISHGYKFTTYFLGVYQLFLKREYPEIAVVYSRVNSNWVCKLCLQMHPINANCKSHGKH